MEFSGNFFIKVQYTPCIKKAVMATYYHMISTNEQPQHQYCPSGADSWCAYRVAEASMKRNLTIILLLYILTYRGKSCQYTKICPVMICLWDAWEAIRRTQTNLSMQLYGAWLPSIYTAAGKSSKSLLFWLQALLTMAITSFWLLWMTCSYKSAFSARHLQTSTLHTKYKDRRTQSRSKATREKTGGSGSNRCVCRRGRHIVRPWYRRLNVENHKSP